MAALLSSIKTSVIAIVAAATLLVRRQLRNRPASGPLSAQKTPDRRDFAEPRLAHCVRAS